MHQPELLLPAGSWEQFQSGLIYGGDAFYLTVGNLSLRAAARGFSWEELKAALELAHQRDKKIYFCLNLFPYESHLTAVRETIAKLKDYAIDGVIVADAGVLSLVRKHLPKVSIHLSTQANSANSEAVKFWQEQGVERVNLARELNFRDIRRVREACPEMELEVFVHGAMCMALSGRCLLSAYLNQRSGNLGKCTQPCRFDYRTHGLLLEESSRQGDPVWQLLEEDGFSRVLAADDQCLIKYLKWFSLTKIDAIKVEGRTKTGLYIAHIADVYKTALNDLRDNKFSYQDYLQEIAQVGSRQLTTGMFLTKPRKIDLTTMPAQPIFAQVVEQIDSNSWQIQIKKPWQAGSDMRLMLPGLERPVIVSNDYAIEDTKGNKLTAAHPGMQLVLKCNDERIVSNVYLLQG